MTPSGDTVMLTVSPGMSASDRTGCLSPDGIASNVVYIVSVIRFRVPAEGQRPPTRERIACA